MPILALYDATPIPPIPTRDPLDLAKIGLATRTHVDLTAAQTALAARFNLLAAHHADVVRDADGDWHERSEQLIAEMTKLFAASMQVLAAFESSPGDAAIEAIEAPAGPAELPPPARKATPSKPATNGKAKPATTAKPTKPRRRAKQPTAAAAVRRALTGPPIDSPHEPAPTVELIRTDQPAEGATPAT